LIGVKSTVLNGCLKKEETKIMNLRHSQTSKSHILVLVYKVPEQRFPDLDKAGILEAPKSHCAELTKEDLKLFPFSFKFSSVSYD
jgi:hypothetical protein